MISNMNDQQTLRNFSMINNNNKTTMIGDVVENNNLSSSNNNNNTNNNNNNNNTSHPNGLNYSPIFPDQFFSHEKFPPEILSSDGHTVMAGTVPSSADSYEISNDRNNFHSYSKSPDQQQADLVVVTKDKTQNKVNLIVGDEDDDDDDDGVAPENSHVTLMGTNSVIPDHHARRPMNAFLIFCKRHRPIVREKYPNLENRAITKILGDWWANLDAKDKSAFTSLAKQYKDAFFSANPDFKWYKLPAPPLRTLSTRPCNSNEKMDDFSSSTFYAASDFPPSPSTFHREKQIRTNVEFQLGSGSGGGGGGGGVPGKKQMDKRQNSVGTFKLADETQMGGLSSLLMDCGTTKRGDDNEVMLGVEEEMTKRKGANMLRMEPDSQHRYKALTAEPLSNMRQHAEQMEAQTTKNLINNNNNNSIKPSKHVDSYSSELNYRRDIEQQWKNMDIDNKLNYSPHLENMLRSQAAEAEALQATPTRTVSVSLAPTSESNLVQPLFESPQSGKDALENDDFDSGSPQKKTSRSCKGKRYQEFMTGKMSPKKMKVKSPATSRSGICNGGIDGGFPISNNSTNTFPHNGYCKPTGGETVVDEESKLRKMNATKVAANLESRLNMIESHPNGFNDHAAAAKMMFNTSDFDLEGKIRSLPCLSLDGYLSRKRETKKKRKISGKSKSKTSKQSPDSKRLEVVGSQKRKARKESITRRDISTTITSPHQLFLIDNVVKVEPATTSEEAGTSTLPLPSTPSFGLSGLVTLAEVAAQEYKLKNDDMIVKDD